MNVSMITHKHIAAGAIVETSNLRWNSQTVLPPIIREPVIATLSKHAASYIRIHTEIGNPSQEQYQSEQVPPRQRDRGVSHLQNLRVLKASPIKKVDTICRNQQQSCDNAGLGQKQQFHRRRLMIEIVERWKMSGLVTSVSESLAHNTTFILTTSALRAS